MYSSSPNLPIIWVCLTTPQSVLTTPATAIIVGSKPKIGMIIKKGTFEMGPNQACLKETAKFISPH